MNARENWQILFRHALSLIDDVLEYGTKHLYWTFGGGTVLMLRHNHRYSKDIDIFVPDPQALGYSCRCMAGVSKARPGAERRAAKQVGYFNKAVGNNVRVVRGLKVGCLTQSKLVRPAYQEGLEAACMRSLQVIVRAATRTIPCGGTPAASADFRYV
jgi:hypothetical protein